MYAMITHVHSDKARRLRLTYSHATWIRVVIPKHASKAQLHKFLSDNAPWIESTSKLEQEHIYQHPDLSNRTKEHYLKYRNEAVQCVGYLVEERSAKIPFKFNAVRVKQMSSKRGSCSSKKNLNFNYKILFLEPHLQDYLVVHEMCHLKEMNHSKAFWSLVETYYGPYKEARSALQRL